MPKRDPKEQALLDSITRQILATNRRKYARLNRVENVSGGLVCIKGTGIIASVVAGMFFAGDSISTIARNYRRSHWEIEQAIRITANAQRLRKSPEVVFENWRRKYPQP